MFQAKDYTKLLGSVHYNIWDSCWDLLLYYAKEYSLKNKRSHKVLWHTETTIWQAQGGGFINMWMSLVVSFLWLIKNRIKYQSILERHEEIIQKHYKITSFFYVSKTFSDVLQQPIYMKLKYNCLIFFFCFW